MHQTTPTINNSKLTTSNYNKNYLLQLHGSCNIKNIFRIYLSFCTIYMRGTTQCFTLYVIYFIN